MDDLIDQDRCQPDSYVAGRGFAGLHQILCQLFQPLALPVQYSQVLRGFLRKLLFLQKVNVVDDGGKGSFDIVGDVGDQLSFQPFGLHPLFHGPGHAGTDGVEIFRVDTDIPEHLTGVDFCFQITGGQRGAHVPDLLELAAQPGCPHNDRQVKDQGQQEKHTAVVAFKHHQCQKSLDNQDAAHQYHGSPGHREDLKEISQNAPDLAAAGEKKGQQKVAKGVAPPFSHFESGRDGHQSGKADQPAQKNAKEQSAQTAEDLSNVCAAGAADEDPVHHDQRNVEPKGVAAEIQFQGNTVLPGGDNALHTIPVPGGADQEQNAQDGAQPHQDT